MSTEVIVWILTALAAVVVVLTRLRFSGEGDSGQFRVGRGVLLAHTVAGTLAILVWIAYLVLGGAVVGIVALALWWATAVLGLLILLRWLPTRGRHAVAATHDTWSEGPGLSVLAHVGMLVGVLVFTGAYVLAAV